MSISPKMAAPFVPFVRLAWVVAASAFRKIALFEVRIWLLTKMLEVFWRRALGV